MNALELRGLTKHYKDFTLGPLDLTLPGGTICGLIGENGAGKSLSLIHISGAHIAQVLLLKGHAAAGQTDFFLHLHFAGKVAAPPVSYTHLDVYKRQGIISGWASVTCPAKICTP